jgi:hypothetical protein
LFSLSIHVCCVEDGEEEDELCPRALMLGERTTVIIIVSISNPNNDETNITEEENGNLCNIA